MENIDFAHYFDLLIDAVIKYGPKLVLALLILWIGMKIINAIVRRTERIFEKRNMDPTLRPFFLSLISWTLKAALIISVISFAGIETTSLVAIFGAAGLAIGLALQGTLANFASGVMLLIFKPFKVGDFIDGGGHMGTVEEIHIFVTKLRTPQNRLIIIPNSQIGSGSLTNYSAAEKVRVDLEVGISYDADIKKAREVILSELEGDDRILTTEDKNVFVTSLGDSSVNLAVRFWVNPGDYWPAFFDHLEGVKVALDNAGIEIPFPQTVVHMAQNQ